MGRAGERPHESHVGAAAAAAKSGEKVDSIPGSLVARLTGVNHPNGSRLGARNGSGSRLELERAGVDAEAQAGRAWAVRKHVPEVAAARGAHHFGPHHAVAPVLLGDDAVEARGLHEARPAGARVVLRLRAEELRAAAGAAIDPRLLRVDVFAGERALRALAPQHLVLLRRELRAPLGVGLLDP